MKVLLVAVNSKFIHSNLAVRYLKDYCKEFDITIFETNINTPYLSVVDEIISFNPDVIGFSTYIFNIDFIKKVILDLRKMTAAKIVLGGPEASGNLNCLEFCDHIIVGEGELAFKDFLLSPNTKDKIIYGREFPTSEWFTPNLEYLKACENKIVYYESTRGCPFSCTYCVSGNESYKKKDLAEVKKDIDFFCGHNLKQVKFIDRTFNADLKRAKEIFSYIIEKNTKTNFHMEMAPDLFDEELFSILRKAKQGQFQFEIGIQTFSNDTLKLINRKMDAFKAEENIKKAIALNNAHVHIDLIFGLPNETISVIRQNVNKAVNLAPHCLQLGFLKVLGSSALKSECEKYNIVYSDNAPYEILYSTALPSGDLIVLRRLEKVFDYFYNDKKFLSTITLLLTAFKDYFDLFVFLGNFMQETSSVSSPIGLMGKTKLLYDFSLSLVNEGKLLSEHKNIIAMQIIESCLRFDYLKLCSDPSLKKPLTPVYPIQGKYNVQSFICNPENLELKKTIISFDYKTKDSITQMFPHKIL